MGLTVGLAREVASLLMCAVIGFPLLALQGVQSLAVEEEVLLLALVVPPLVDSRPHW